MSGSTHPKLENIDLERSRLLEVIYDDESLTLEMDFRLLRGHAKYEPDENGACFRKGFISFADIDDLRIKQSQSGSDDETSISSATIEGDYAFVDSGWGEIELTAQWIRVVID